MFRVAREESFPDYSGGTMPDLHRLPFYALAGTQDISNKLAHPVVGYANLV